MRVLDHHLLQPKPAKPCPNTLSLSLLTTGFAIGTSGCESSLEIHRHSRPFSPFPPSTPFPLSLTCVENLLEWSEVEQHVERPELNKHRPLPVVPANFLTSRQETLERAGPSKAWRAGGGSGSAGSGTLAATEGARPGPALT
ncbi:unnamed protein product [Leuciscus chuanchicus]